MNGNTANGGLAVKWQGKVVFARRNEWFLDADSDCIYYSDRGDANRLYKKANEADKGKMLVKKPCAGVTVFKDGLYFINEDDRKVYRCSKDGKGIMACSKAETKEFAVLEDGTVYANPNARRVCAAHGKVYYADGANEGNLFALTGFCVKTGGTETFPDIKPSYINVHDANVYYTDRSRGNIIYRLEPAGTRMSVYGGSAECLHVLDDWLYFLSDKKWKRLSLLNFGEAEDI